MNSLFNSIESYLKEVEPSYEIETDDDNDQQLRFVYKSEQFDINVVIQFNEETECYCIHCYPSWRVPKNERLHALKIINDNNFTDWTPKATIDNKSGSVIFSLLVNCIGIDMTNTNFEYNLYHTMFICEKQTLQIMKETLSSKTRDHFRRP